MFPVGGSSNYLNYATCASESVTCFEDAINLNLNLRSDLHSTAATDYNGRPMGPIPEHRFETAYIYIQWNCQVSLSFSRHCCAVSRYPQLY